MKGLLGLMLVIAIGPAQPALAQVLADPPPEWRLGGARLTIPSGPDRVKEVAGGLVSDSKGKQIKVAPARKGVLVSVRY